MKVWSSVAMVIATLLLVGCAVPTDVEVTCSTPDMQFSCWIGKPSAQDPPAPNGAKDEKPDRPLAQPLSRLREDAP